MAQLSARVADAPGGGRQIARLVPGGDGIILRRPIGPGGEPTIVLDPPPPPPPPSTRGLPQVDDETAPAFRDQNLADAWWYVPDFQLVPPDAGSTPDQTPFLFSFRTSGHDAQNRPGIDATITLTVRAAFSATAQALVGGDGSAALPVPLTGLAFTLLVPYRDESGQPATLSVPATSVDTADEVTTATFAVKDAFARAAYGVLSTPGYQDRSAQLQVDYTFAGVRRVWTGPRPWPVHRPGVDVAGDPFPGRPVRPQFLPAAAAMVVQPAGPDAVEAAPEPVEARPAAAAMVAAPGPVEARPAAVRLLADQPALVATDTGTSRLTVLQASPEVSAARFDGELVRGRWAGIDGDATFAWVTVSRQAVLDAFVPCATRGGLYVDLTDTGRTPVGCQDSLALGTLPDRLYAELSELATDRYRVFWSLGLPGTYLVLPLHYRVSRTDDQLDATGVLQPLIGWLQEFDATHDDELPCLLTATLAPDLIPGDLAGLVDALADRTAHPQIVLPTSPASGLTSVAATWALGIEGTPATVLDGDLIRVGLRTSYADAAIVHAQLGAGAQPLIGNATFTLSDHSTLGPVAMHLSVDELAGPWPAGPVAASTAAGSVTLTNRAGGDATIRTLRCSTADGTTSARSDGLPVVVAAGGTATLPVPEGTAAVVPDYALGPAAPATVAAARIYLDDLHTVVVVVNDVPMSTAGIARIDVTAWLGSDPSISFSMSPSLPQYELDIVEPLVADRQADSAVIHLTGTVLPDAGAARPCPEIAVDLHDGAVIRLSLLLPQD
jgi:hypothetical protein